MDVIKGNNIGSVGALEGEVREKGSGGLFKEIMASLTAVSQWVGGHLAKFTGLIPCEGTRPGCCFCYWSGHIRKATNKCFSLRSSFLSSSSLSHPPFSPKKKKKNGREGDNFPNQERCRQVHKQIQNKKIFAETSVRHFITNPSKIKNRILKAEEKGNWLHTENLYQVRVNL